MHGRNTYVARPDAGTAPVAVIVIVSDAFGWELPNTRALADAYARRGPFLVYVPDFMDGRPKHRHIQYIYGDYLCTD